MTYPVPKVAHGVAHPEEIVHQLSQAAAAGYLVSVQDVKSHPDGRVSAVFVEHSPTPTQRPDNRWTLWHTGVLCLTLAIAVTLTALAYLFVLVATWIVAHPASTASLVVIVALAIALVAVGISKYRAGSGDGHA